MTLSKGMTEYLRYHALHKGGSPSSVEQYERTYRSFLAYLKGQNLPDVPQHFNGQTVLGWSLAEGERGVGPRTLSSRLGHLSSLAAFLRRLKDGRGRPLIEGDPTREFERPKYKRPESKFLHPEELKAFLSVPRAAGESIARDLFLDTMLRVSELANANVGDIEGPNAEGRYSLRTRVKGGAEKRVPLSPAVAEGLLEYLMGRGIAGPQSKPQAPLLVNTRGERWTRSGLTQLVGRIAKQAGITRFSVSAHKLRHTAATIALHSGVNPLAVSKLLNHTNMKTTEQYLHLIPSALHDARDKQAAGLAEYIR